MSPEPVSLGRRLFAVTVFVLMAGVCVILALIEGGTYPYGYAALFVWLAVFAGVQRGRNARLDNVLEFVGGAVLFVAGFLTILERDAVRDMAEAGRDRRFLLIWIVAPALIVGGLFYTLRGLSRILRSRARS